MSEREFWHKVRDRLSPFGELRRVENRVDVGFPDVLYCLRGVTGLLELKYEPRWASDGIGPVVRGIKTLRPEQVAWARRWHAAGGRVHMLLQIQRDHFLLGAPSWGLLVHGIVISRPALFAASTLGAAGEGALLAGPLVRCLTSG